MPTRSLFVLLLGAALTACLDDSDVDPSEYEQTPVQVDKGFDPQTPVAAVTALPGETTDVLRTKQADFLVDDCQIVANPSCSPDQDPCAVACDPEALGAFIPEGTCITFSCPTKDGGVVKVGGCN